MSHSDNTQQKYDERFPNWLAFKLMVRHMEPHVLKSRKTMKYQWQREVELELSA